MPPSLAQAITQTPFVYWKVRVKNRLDPDYNAEESLGYRDVALNLRVVTAETRQLGSETHVCEVQLLLRAFAELKVSTR